MFNLAVERDPQTWDDFLFHERQVGRLKKYLATNQHPYALTLSGASGTGKTSAARLYIKSLFCLNRKPGEIQPCNQCASCKLDPRTAGSINNVIWVQQGRDETLTTQFNHALEEAYQPPNGFDEDHRFYKVIVFDELQSVPKDKLQALLFYPELPQLIQTNRVIFIFLTMDEEKIDPTVMRALCDRSVYVRFKKLSETQIQQYLSRNFPGLHPETIDILAHYADGSVRRVLRALQDCYTEDESLSPTGVAETLYYVDHRTRSRLWGMLKNRSYKELQTFWQSSSEKFDPEVLIQQMLRDLDAALLTNPTPDILQAQDILYQFSMSRAKVRALDALKMLAGLDLIQTPNAHPLERGGYERVMTA